MIKDDVKSCTIKPGPGRPKGSKNKLTNIKDEFLFAYEVIGGLGGLTAWAKKEENRTEFYRMLTRLFPREIKAEITVERAVSEYSVDELVGIITEGKTTDTPDNIH